MPAVEEDGQGVAANAWHSHFGDQSDDEDQDCCRICRGSAPPLFYPCKCSGSIKYVHQQCLMDWLGHSGNTHCELCKHEFVFTPVYAKDAPTRLPWAELVAGLIKRAVGGVKVAHRVWVVACVWLIAVPWITCLAWRLAFLRGFDEVPRLLRERWNVLAIATDCIQGSLLSIAIVFVNMSVFSLKQHLKNAVRRLENQLLRDAVPHQQQPAQLQAVAAAGQLAPLAAGPAQVQVQPAQAPAAAAAVAGGAVVQISAGNAAAAGTAPDIQGGSTAAGIDAGLGTSVEPQHGAAATSSAAGGSSSSAQAAAPVPNGFAGDSGAGSSSSQAALEGVAAAVAADSRQHQLQQAPSQQQLQQQPSAGDALVAAAAAIGVDAIGPGADEAMLAAAAAVGAVADPGGAADGPAEAADVWGDVPIEELLGLQGPWVDFVEMVVLLLAGNASFMAGCVYLPLNIGRLMLTAIRKASMLMTQEQHQLLLQLVAQHVRLPFISKVLAFTASFLSTHLPAVQDAAATAATSALGAATTAAAAAAAPSPAGVFYAAGDTPDPMPLLPLNVDLLLKELQAQMELPARADFVALSMGHALLGVLLLVGLWLYVSMRLWRAARRRLQATGRQPLLQVMRSTCRWVMSAATMVYQGSKLVLLLALELGAMPVLAGLWLDFCALPLTASSVGQRSELLAKAPVISALMHWVIGVGFVLAFTFLLCVLREVLRPGALPFIKDPTNPERNPVREMLEEPLLRHLGRVVMSWLLYAGLCVVLVHIPALIAKKLLPSLYPLRLALFDPLTQIPADMLLMHIFIPLTVEHVRVKGAVKFAVQTWLRVVARLLNWSDYLLPPDARLAAAARAQRAAQQQQQAAGEPAAAAAAAAATAAVVAAPAGQAAGAAQQQEGSSPGEATAEQPQGDAAAAPAAAPVPQQQQQPCLQHAGSLPVPPHTPQGDQQQQRLRHARSVPAPLVQPLVEPSQQQLLVRPVQWYEQQDSYGWKVLGLVLALLVTMVLLNTLMLTLPIGVGRALFTALRLPFKNDLFTGIIGLIVLSGGYTFAAAVASSASLVNVRAVATAAWRWGLLMGQCAVLLVLWVGVVATMLGMLCELVLLPLRLPPNQTALIYLYQDWTMGVLALKLWHLLVMVAPRRDGRAPPDPDSWQAHFDALQAGGLRNLDLNRALTKIVLPVLLNLATCLAVPYVITRGLLPMLGLPAPFLQYASLYGHQVFHGCYLAYLGSKKLAGLAVQLHNTIRDDRYLVGRELHNFELRRQEQAAAAAAAAQAAAAQAAAATADAAAA